MSDGVSKVLRVLSSSTTREAYVERDKRQDRITVHFGKRQKVTKFKKSNITIEVGGHSGKKMGKSSQNLVLRVYISHRRAGVYFVCNVCTLLNVVSHYDLSVLSMLVMGFPKKY